MKTRNIYLLLVLCAVLGGCAKAPENIGSPGVKIDLSIVDNKEVYVVNVTGFIENKNEDIMFIDMKGDIELVNPSSGKAVKSFSFSIPEIFPFDMGVVNIKEQQKEKQVAPLLEMLNLDREKLVSEGSSSGIHLNEDQIRIKNLEYRKENIIKVLKEKNEAN